MITDAEVATMIPAKDLERTRRFYEDVLGFTPDRDQPGAISYRTGGGRFNLYDTEFVGTAQRTLIGWLVDDIDAAVRDLANRGVSFESYGMPGLRRTSAASQTWAASAQLGSRIPRETCSACGRSQRRNSSARTPVSRLSITFASIKSRALGRSGVRCPPDDR